MNIIFHKNFYDSSYSRDGAASEGRIEIIVNELRQSKEYSFVEPQPASKKDILLAHNDEYVQLIETNEKLYKMALLAVGGAIKASEYALHGQPTFACVRPPGHHAYRTKGWGYCYFNNVGIALLKLKKGKLIESAFVLDIDTHTGDGTIDVLSDWKEAIVFNPMADDNKKYIKLLEEKISEVKNIDIIAVSAGFDTYKKDVGNKLDTFDYYLIGTIIKKFAKRMGHNKIFASLEGGYYIPDLGKNVKSFCDGLKANII